MPGTADGLLLAIFLDFYTGAATFSSKKLLNFSHKAEWTPFQTHYFSENLVASEIEPRPLDAPFKEEERAWKTISDRLQRSCY
jgi:hypothetical protein